jgi:hypothetical protein
MAKKTAFEKDTARTNVPNGSPPGHVGSSIEASYGFVAAAAASLAASAALEAASVAAVAASLAAPAALLAASPTLVAASPAAVAAAPAALAAAPAALAAASAGASVLLPQALSTNAATKALRASLVFIYRYPRKILRIKRFR